MKSTSAVRRFWTSGHSLVVALSPAARELPWVREGSALHEVITNDGTVELQPPAPPSAGARRRRHLSNRTRTLERAQARLRAKAQEAYQAGYALGFDHGAMWYLKRLDLPLQRLILGLERCGVLEADQTRHGAGRQRRRHGPTSARGNARRVMNDHGRPQNKTRSAGRGGAVAQLRGAAG